jgi:hypothetical protein
VSKAAGLKDSRGCLKKDFRATAGLATGNFSPSRAPTVQRRDPHKQFQISEQSDLKAGPHLARAAGDIELSLT